LIINCKCCDFVGFQSGCQSCHIYIDCKTYRANSKLRQTFHQQEKIFQLFPEMIDQS
jgi:hypothetical protein